MLFSVLCLQSPVVRAASKSTTVACATSTDVSEAAANNPKPAGTVHYVTRQGAAGNFNVRLDPSIEDGGGVLELVAHKMNTIALLTGGERHARWSSAARSTLATAGLANGVSIVAKVTGTAGSSRMPTPGVCVAHRRIALSGDALEAACRDAHHLRASRGLAIELTSWCNGGVLRRADTPPSCGNGHCWTPECGCGRGLERPQTPSIAEPCEGAAAARSPRSDSSEVAAASMRHASVPSPVTSPVLVHDRESGGAS